MKECTIRDISPLSEEVILELRLKHDLWSSRKRWVGRQKPDMQVAHIKSCCKFSCATHAFQLGKHLPFPIIAPK